MYQVSNKWGQVFGMLTPRSWFSADLGVQRLRGTQTCLLEMILPVLLTPSALETPREVGWQPQWEGHVGSMMFLALCGGWAWCLKGPGHDLPTLGQNLVAAIL